MYLINNIYFENKKSLMSIVSISFLCAISVAIKSQVLILLSIFLVLVFIIFGDVNNIFLLFLSISPFASALQISNKGIFFFLIFIAVFKTIYLNRKINKRLIFYGIILLFLEILNDFFFIKTGVFLNVFANLLFFIFFTSHIDYLKLNVNEILIVLVITCYLVLFAMLIENNGNISVYENDINAMVRFGATEWQAAGATEVPIYSLVGMCATIVLLIKSKVSLVLKAFLVLLTMIGLYLSVLSLSRVFYLGLISSAIYFLFILFFEKRKFKALIIIFIILTIILLYFEYNKSIILMAFERMNNRHMSDFSSGRISIWESIFTYLMNNPITLLFGAGIRNYTNIGYQNNLAFSMSAHNLALDGIMSFGLIGIVSLINYFKYSFKKAKLYKLINFLDIYKLPLLVYFTIKLTGGMFYYFHTFTFLMALIYISFGNYQKTEL